MNPLIVLIGISLLSLSIACATVLFEEMNEESLVEQLSYYKRYIQKCLGIYWYVFHWKILRILNRYFLKTYPLIEECARCRDCGRSVHDYLVPDKLWLAVIGTFNGVWCYDCFCNRADRKGMFGWRMGYVEKWTPV